jgi:hypothetical protein
MQKRLYMELLVAEESDEDPSDGALSDSGDEYKDYMCTTYCWPT